MTNPDPQQQQMIRDAMKAIAERKPGRSKLVYNKDKRTIEAVSDSAQTPRALNITAEDADMFGVATLSSQWLREQWPHFHRNRFAYVRFNSWDDGDAFTQADLGPLSSPIIVQGIILLEDNTTGESDNELRIVLVKDDSAKPQANAFEAPDGAVYKLVATKKFGGTEEPVEINLVEVQPALA